jgi:hypothetical protein
VTHTRSAGPVGLRQVAMGGEVQYDHQVADGSSDQVPNHEMRLAEAASTGSREQLHMRLDRGRERSFQSLVLIAPEAGGKGQLAEHSAYRSLAVVCIVLHRLIFATERDAVAAVVVTVVPVPKRTNTFQQVVRLVYELMAEGAKVEESVMLDDLETGGEREVDVLITTAIAGIPFRIQIEATAQGEPPDVKWVEAELGKNKAVGTDKLVLVSESGFSKNARKKALANGAIPIAPEDMTSEDQVGEIVNRLGSVWPKTVALMPTEIAGVVLVDGVQAAAKDLTLDTWIVTEADEELGTVSEEIQRRFGANFQAICEQIGLSEIAGDVEAYFTLGMPDWIGSRDGTPFNSGLRWQPEESEPPEFHRLLEIQVRAKAAIAVTEIQLTHMKLDKFLVAYGTGDIGGNQTLLVVAEDGAGTKGALRVDDSDA